MYSYLFKVHFKYLAINDGNYFLSSFEFENIELIYNV
jgi:hypothetical protein